MSETTFLIKDCRVSFPAFHKPPEFEDGKKGKYGAKLLLDPEQHKAVIDQLESAIEALIKDELKVKRLSSDKLCLRDGIDVREEYDGYLCLSASSKEPIPVLDHTAQAFITDPDKCRIYSGCYVNAKVILKSQDSKSWGKRVNAYFVAVQFNRDGDTFGKTASLESVAEGFGMTEAAADADAFFAGHA